MHPQVRLQDPDARCPICGMELIPVTQEAGEEAPRRLTMSEAARQLAEVRTVPVERRFVTKVVPMVGKVDYDETRMRSITARVPGRLDRLHVDYTGVAVRQGAPLVYLYSPELLVAQKALLESDRAYEEIQTSKASATNLEMARANVTANEQRLFLWGLSREQIEEIRQRGTASDHMTILSPMTGIVIQKRAVEGDYVKVGTRIYDIADLNRVWVYLDAYESDLPWIRYGQEVEFEAEAHPGEVFKGRISFVDPFLNERTRTVPLRVTVQNADGRLKPGMFVRARIRARLATEGKIVEPFLAGKWVSPAHPEVVRDEPGDCPICGTPLISADSLGYVGEDAPAPLVVPATAPLLTGKRSVVYVEVPNTERPTYDGRVVRLGPRTEEHYLVREGLREGERVVVKGNFKIDSALQIQARPSMMSPPEGEPPVSKPPGEREPPRAPLAFRQGLSHVLHRYLDLTAALAGDDLDGARRAGGSLEETLEHPDASTLEAKARLQWDQSAKAMRGAAAAVRQAKDIEAARHAYLILSEGLLQAVRRFGHAGPEDLARARCPMAFDNRGADWLQRGDEIRNPYFGASMLRCGSVQERFPAPEGN
jgi:Cu(I)/Ag(I) efflux system membrane fusion protein